MRMSNNWIARLIQALAFSCFRALWNLKERILNPNAGSTGKGARIYDIAFRFVFDKTAVASTLKSFCLRFKEEVPLSDILGENVYLYCFDKTQVGFIVVKPGKEIWRSKFSGFYTIAQNDHAEQMIVISHQDFFSICSALPDPGSKINFIHSIPRSGSNLLIQMFEETGQCLSVSEPQDFTILAKRSADLPHEESIKLFRSIGKYVTRSVGNNEKYKWYFAKLSSPATIGIYDILKESLPEAKHVFLYREFEDNLKSNLHALENVPLFNLIEVMVKIPKVANSVRSMFLNAASEHCHVSPAKVDEMASLWYKHKAYTSVILWNYCASYNFFLNQCNLPAIKYDDLVHNREENMRRILEYFELPVNLVDKALVAMERDAHGSSPFARKTIGTKCNEKLDGGIEAFADHFCDLFNIPRLKENRRHPSTITIPVSE